MVQQATGWSPADIVKHVKALIVTRGADGSTIHTPQGEIVIPAAKPAAVVDPTGCGDAYRAGLIHGLLHGLDWSVTGRIASLLGALKVASRGPRITALQSPSSRPITGLLSASSWHAERGRTNFDRSRGLGAPGAVLWAAIPFTPYRT